MQVICLSEAPLLVQKWAMFSTGYKPQQHFKKSSLTNPFTMKKHFSSIISMGSK